MSHKLMLFRVLEIITEVHAFEISMRCENNPVNSRIHGLRRSGEHNETSNDVQRSLRDFF